MTNYAHYPVLKQYAKNGIRTVTDEDDGTIEKDVSPVVHQVSLEFLVWIKHSRDLYATGGS